MKKVVVNVEFIDRYTKKKVKAGSKLELTEERIAEIKEVNPHFITVIGNVENPEEKTGSGKSENPEEEKDTEEKGKSK